MSKVSDSYYVICQHNFILIANIFSFFSDDDGGGGVG